MGASAAVGNALTQTSAVVLGLQPQFDWRGVAASAMAAGWGDRNESDVQSDGFVPAMAYDHENGSDVQRDASPPSGYALSGGGEGLRFGGLRAQGGPGQVEVEPAAPSGHMSSPEETLVRMLRAQLRQTMSTSDDMLIQAGLGGPNGIGARVIAMGQNLDNVRAGTTGTNEQRDFQKLNDNLDNEIASIGTMARESGLSEQQTLLLKNSFALARYDALNKVNPDMQWTQLGIFAANTVRIGIVDSFNYANALESTAAAAKLIPGLPTQLGGIGLEELARMSRDMARETLQGQINVLKDVGSLAIMHQMYGAEAMSKAHFRYGDLEMTDEARKSFRLQANAEAARASGDMQRFYKLQTDAAIEMGRHEQGNLQRMWDKPAMANFAKVNALLLSKVGWSPVRPDIYIGTNPAIDKDYSELIRYPKGSEDLSVLQNRINIAKNGFETLNRMRQTTDGNRLIEHHQSQLGQGIGLVQPPKPFWGEKT